MSRVAAVDCGTNSLRLLVADYDESTGTLREVERRTTIVRLGQGVDRTRQFAPVALARTLATVDDYARVIAAAGVDATRFVATSAARDVRNRDDLIRGVRSRLGVQPEVIGGGEEARLCYDGATHELVGRADVIPPLVVLDIGGGSTELVSRGGPGDQIRGQSLDIGAVRLTERHLASDPPTRAELQAVRDDVDAALRTLEDPLPSTGTLIGVAGTVTTMAAMVLGLSGYDRSRVHLAWLALDELLVATDRLVAMSVAARAALPFMDPGRADVIAAGALVLTGVLRSAGVSGVLVSEHDILDGIAWSIT
ncbi:MAG: exopolyphosphatase [Nocardioidaceae bacterium]